jgi:hypothetical protein
MITRREAALGGLLSIGWLAAPCGCHATSSPKGFGCKPVDDEIYLSLTAEQKQFGPSGKPTFVESGNRDLDYAMAQTLSMLTDTWKVLPAFAYYDDSKEPNAAATAKRWFSRADGTVIFGRTLLGIFLRDSEQPDVAISMVVAHEFGHIAQHKYRLIHPILTGQKTLKRLELHADFLAGYFAGVRKLARPSFPASVYATTVSRLGDSPSNAVDYHGTGQERAQAIVAGFQTSFRDRRGPGEALQIGVNYVRTL